MKLSIRWYILKFNLTKYCDFIGVQTGVCLMAGLGELSGVFNRKLGNFWVGKEYS